MIPNNQWWFNSKSVSIIQPYFFETFPTVPTVAYSLSQLSSSSTRTIRVRRSSDNTQTDIGFVNRELDTASLLTFTGGGDAFVTIWYSQVGTNHLIQNTQSLQPRIVLAGVVEVDNVGVPMIYWDGVDDYLTLTTPISAAAPYSVFQVNKRQNTSQASPMLSSSVADAPFAIMEYTDSIYYSRSSTNTIVSTNMDTGIGRKVISAVQNASSAIWMGHASIPGSIFPVGGVGNFIDLGRRETVYARGYSRELIFYASDQTANVQNINADRTGNGAILQLPVSATNGYLILEAGQSNMTDRFPILGNLPANLQSLQSDTWTFFKQSNAISDNGYWSKMKVGINTTAEGGIYTRYGLDVSLGAKLKNTYGKAGYFVPTAVGGTGLDSASPQPNWAATTGQLYTRMILMFQQALSQSAKSLTPVLLWNQGEFDAGVLAYANNYQTNLTNLFAQIRTDLGLPNLKIIIVKLGNDTIYTYKNTVRTAQVNVSTLSANNYIYESPYPIGTDGEHYNPQVNNYVGIQSSQLIGEDLANLIATF